VPKYVATRTLTGALPWDGSTALTGDLEERVDELKDRHDEVHVIGSLDLTQSLLALGLVDQLNVWLHPVTLGSGKRLFGEGTAPAAFRLTDSAVFPRGIVELRYESAGAPTYGDMTEESAAIFDEG
jgi:dihydrofolate reductase